MILESVLGKPLASLQFYIPSRLSYIVDEPLYTRDDVGWRPAPYHYSLDWNSRRELKTTLWRNTAHWHSSLGLVSLLYHTTQDCLSGVVSLKIGCFFFQSLIKKVPHRFVQRAVWQRHFLNSGFPFPPNSRLCQVEKKKKTLTNINFLLGDNRYHFCRNLVQLDNMQFYWLAKLIYYWDDDDEFVFLGQGFSV